MTRRRILLVLALSLAGLTTAALGLRFVYAAEPAQRVVRLGFVGPESPTTRRGVSVFWQHLRELGWVEGQNLVVERRWAEGRLDRLPALMAEVVGLSIDVLVTYSTPGGLAAKNATNTVPIVVATMGDPVGTGLVASLAHPGGNLTGLSLAQAEGIGGKWLELLQETVPRVSTVAVIGNPESPFVRNLVKELEAAAPARHLKLRVIEVHKPEAIDGAFARARHAQAILIPADPLMVSNRVHITALAAKYRLPGSTDCSISWTRVD